MRCSEAAAESIKTCCMVLGDEQIVQTNPVSGPWLFSRWVCRALKLDVGDFETVEIVLLQNGQIESLPKLEGV